MQTSMYDLLLQLPIFQGLSSEALTSILGTIPFGFCKYKEGQVIIQSGDVCDHITFVLSGSVKMYQPVFDGRISVCQTFEGPHTLPFYYLFGVHNCSENTLIASSENVGVMELSKEHFLQLLPQHPLLLVNVLNMLSTHAQKQHLVFDHSALEEPVLRLSSWILAFTERKATEIELRASESDWCTMLRLEPAEFWRSVAILEGKHIVESEGDTLKLTDRYGLRHYVTLKSQSNE